MGRTLSINMGDGQGKDVKFTFTFKSDGKKLTGTTIGPGEKTIDIQNGKIEGNKISFEVPVKTAVAIGTVFYTGELSGDDLKLSFIRKLEFNPNIGIKISTDSPPQTTLVCKRVKNGE
jgi:hypothetical protein